MVSKLPLKQESIISKIRNSDNSEVYNLKKADQILWTLRLLKKEYNIEDHIAVSVLIDVLVEGLEITTNAKSITNSLARVGNKINRKNIEGEISYKIMHEGISHIEKLVNKKTSTKGKSKKYELNKIESVQKAIDTVKNLEKEKHFKPGLYFVVLIDLVGSTKASSKISPDENKIRIKQFIKFTKTALPFKPKNFTSFIKDIGDASLFLFSNFTDILDWAEKVDNLCDEYNTNCIKTKKPDIYHMFSKKCIHIGEVHFDEKSDPIALVINQISKIEKEFKKDQLGITDAVKQIILPLINSGTLKAKKIRNIILPGETVSRPLWIILF